MAPDVAEVVFGAGSQRAVQYAHLLTGVGVDRGVIGPREAPRLWERHLLNSAVVAGGLSETGAACDVGSGAGLPGIPLAICRPDIEFTLLEPRANRCDFLKWAVAELELANVRVEQSRAEEHTGRYRSVVARAVAPLDKLIPIIRGLCEPGGEILAFKGLRADEELSAAGPTLDRLGVGDRRIELYGGGIVSHPTTVIRAVVGPEVSDEEVG